MDQGLLAGLAIVAELRGDTQATGRELARQYRSIRRRMRRHARFQAALWQLFAAPRLSVDLSHADTLICRCEELDRQSLEQILARRGIASLAAVKKASRAGMGRCQGRYCTSLLAALSRQTGGPLIGDIGNIGNIGDEDFFAPRPPAKPVPIGRIAQPCGETPPLVDADVKT